MDHPASDHVARLLAPYLARAYLRRISDEPPDERLDVPPAASVHVPTVDTPREEDA